MDTSSIWTAACVIIRDRLHGRGDQPGKWPGKSVERQEELIRILSSFWLVAVSDCRHFDHTPSKQYAHYKEITRPVTKAGNQKGRDGMQLNES